jgi:hypothetical protein
MQKRYIFSRLNGTLQLQITFWLKNDSAAGFSIGWSDLQLTQAITSSKEEVIKSFLSLQFHVIALLQVVKVDLRLRIKNELDLIWMMLVVVVRLSCCLKAK